MDTGGDIPEINSGRIVLDRNNLAENSGGMIVGGDIPERNSARIVPENLAHPHNLDRIELIKLGMSADVARLYAILKQNEMLQVGNEGVRNVAKTLKVLAEVEKPTYTDIRKQTGQSESGINKMRASMRKRNLIVRTKQHKFHLTEKGVRLLRESGG